MQESFVPDAGHGSASSHDHGVVLSNERESPQAAPLEADSSKMIESDSITTTPQRKGADDSQLVGRHNIAHKSASSEDTDSTFTAESDPEEDLRDKRWKAQNIKDEETIAKRELLKARLLDARHRIDKSKHHLKKKTMVRLESAESSACQVPEGPFNGALELFCGCGELTVALGNAGFAAIGIDCKFNKDKPKGPYLVLDLSSDDAVDVILRLIADKRVVLVHIAPPCGTASRAREIRRRGVDPKPLRTDEHPDGIPGLSGEDSKRVEQANKLYKFTAQLICALERCKVAWSLENPTNSLFWKTSFMQQAVLHMCGAATKVDFDMCMHGGGRKKRTTFMHGSAMFSKLGSKLVSGEILNRQ